MSGFCATVAESATNPPAPAPVPAPQAAAPTLEIVTERLLLFSPRLDRVESMRDFVLRNLAHLKPWSPPAPADLHLLSTWQAAIEKHHAAYAAGSEVKFWLSLRDAPELGIGSIGFTQIFRGAFCSCVLGYQIDGDYEGKGLMHEALRAAIRYMFDEQKLHRIAANYRPENVRSGRLLAKLGFRIDGYAKDYMFIDGAWRDHVLTSRVNDQFTGDTSMSGWKNAASASATPAK